MGSNTNKWFIGQPYEMNPHEVKYDTKITSFNAQKSEEDYQAMKLLIAEQGQQKPCLLREGLMGDGVNRTKAAKEQKILQQYKNQRYIGACVLESGNTELFTKDVLGLDQ